MGKKRNLKKISKYMSYVSIVWLVIVGFLLGILLGDELERLIYVNLVSGGYIFFIIALIFSVVIGIVFHITIHELGHMFFGLLTGYKFCSFRIGKWMWMKENEKIVIKKYTLVGTGGQCLMSPPDMNEGKFPYVLYNLGGSIFNILFGIFFIAPYMLFSEIPYLSLFFVVASIEGFVSGIMNGIPFSFGIINNDGYNILKMCEDKKSLYSFWIQLKIGEKMTEGIRLKDMPLEWFTVGSFDSMRNTMVSSIAVFRANRLMDEHKFEDAYNYIRNLLSSRANIVGVHEIVLNFELLYCELIGKARKEVVESIYNKDMKYFMKGMKNNPTTIRTKYVYKLLYENNIEEAEDLKNKFEKVVESYPYKAEIISERELMEIAYGIRKYRLENENL